MYYLYLESLIFFGTILILVLKRVKQLYHTIKGIKKMLLNNIPCLDKGYVALFNSANPKLKLGSLTDIPSSSLPKLKQLSSFTFIFKCPIFVQTHLSQYAFTIINANNSPDVEAYIPNVGEIKATDLDTSRDIADDFFRTTEALLLNPKAYQADGCDRFVSQTIMPISTYTKIIVHGSIQTWEDFISQSNLPSAIEAYRDAVEQVYKMEW